MLERYGFHTLKHTNATEDIKSVSHKVGGSIVFHDHRYCYSTGPE